MVLNPLVYAELIFNETSFLEGFVAKRELIGISHVGPWTEGINIPVYNYVNEYLKWNVSFLFSTMDERVRDKELYPLALNL